MARRRRVIGCLTVAACILISTAARQDDGRLSDPASTSGGRTCSNI
jgi:hypothetical protein